MFVVLLCGLAFAVLIAILEFCWNAKKNAQNDRVSGRGIGRESVTGGIMRGRENGHTREWDRKRGGRERLIMH